VKVLKLQIQKQIEKLKKEGQPDDPYLQARINKELDHLKEKQKTLEDKEKAKQFRQTKKEIRKYLCGDLNPRNQDEGSEHEIDQLCLQCMLEGTSVDSFLRKRNFKTQPKLISLSISDSRELEKEEARPKFHVRRRKRLLDAVEED